METKQEYVEIDLWHLLQVLWHRLWAIILSAAVFGAGAFMIAYFLITPLYKSSALLYVNNSSFSLGGTSFSISSSELSAAQSLVNTYTVILNARTTLNEVIEEANLDCSYEELKNMISAEAINGTEIFSVTVTNPDPKEAKRIANIIADILPDKISDIVDGSSVKIVDYAVTPASKDSPSITRYTVIGMLLGVVLSSAIIIVLDILDDVIRSEDYLMQTYDIPVLAAIPDLMASESKSGYYSEYRSKVH